MKSKIFWLLFFGGILRLSWAQVSPAMVWEKDFNTTILDHAFASGTGQTAVVTSNSIFLLNNLGQIIAQEANLGNYYNVSLSNCEETVLLWNNFTNEYFIFNKGKMQSFNNSFSGSLLLSNYGDCLLNWQLNGNEITAFDLMGNKIWVWREEGSQIFNLKLSPADDYLLVLVKKRGQKQLYKISLRDQKTELLVPELSQDQLTELVISGEGRYLGVNNVVYDLNKGEMAGAYKVEPTVVAITNDGKGYLSLDSRKQALSYGELGGSRGIWGDRHSLDQWQKVFIDSRDRYILTLSYLDSAIEYTMKIYNLKGEVKLTWRFNWDQDDRINFTRDLRYTLFKHNNRLTFYQLY